MTGIPAGVRAASGVGVGYGPHFNAYRVVRRPRCRDDDDAADARAAPPTRGTAPLAQSPAKATASCVSVARPRVAPDVLHDGAAFGRIIEALEGRGCRVTGTGRQQKAQCPAHDDRNPSLSIMDAGGRVLIHCHAGCGPDNILAALGLTRADLYELAQRRDGGDDWTPWRDRCPCMPVARYPYVDERGELLYQHIRGQHKEFAFRRPDPSSRSGWRWSLGDTRRVLYRLPQLLAAPDSACIFLVEGEEDVHALEAAGEIATTTDSGALAGAGHKQWRPEWTAPLAGRDVLVVADRDAPGRVHARHVLAAIRPVTRSAWIVQAAAGKDAADHLGAGYGVPDFIWWCPE
jgi:hypothetical protein